MHFELYGLLKYLFWMLAGAGYILFWTALILFIRHKIKKNAAKAKKAAWMILLAMGIVGAGMAGGIACAMKQYEGGKDMGNKYFERALSDFVRDMASGDEIRHLADLGYTVEKIYANLTYPASREQIGKTVWQHYLDKGIIRMEEPSGEIYTERIDYVLEQGRYGARHFRQVKVREENPDREYVACDFGKEKYQNERDFLKRLEPLMSSDRDYILGLPWPLKKVYHVKDERMERILDVLKKR